MKPHFIRCILPCLVFLSALTHADAQTKTTASKPAVTSAAPSFKSTWGPRASSTLSLAEVRNMLKAPLIIKDAKGNPVSVSRFRVTYKFRSQFEDPETGQASFRPDLLVQFFDADRLSDLWVQELDQRLKSGDEIKFDLITVRLKNGKKYEAPGLLFTVK